MCFVCLSGPSIFIYTLPIFFSFPLNAIFHQLDLSSKPQLIDSSCSPVVAAIRHGSDFKSVHDWLDDHFRLTTRSKRRQGKSTYGSEDSMVSVAFICIISTTIETEATTTTTSILITRHSPTERDVSLNVPWFVISVCPTCNTLTYLRIYIPKPSASDPTSRNRLCGLRWEPKSSTTLKPRPQSPHLQPLLCISNYDTVLLLVPPIPNLRAYQISLHPPVAQAC